MATSQQAQAAQDAAVREAMMEELGISRIESLPMSDRPRHNDHHRNPNLVVRPAKVSRPTPKAATSGGNSVGAMWQSAISSGIFNDKDAAEVQGLDDLGGGRLYDARTQHAKARTSQILAGINAFSNELGPGLRNGGREATPMHRLVGPSRTRRFAPRKMPTPTGDEPLFVFTNSQPSLPASSAKENGHLQAQLQARMRAKELGTLFSQLKDTVKEPAFNVYKALVLHKHSAGQTPAVLFLSAKEPPLMGVFDLISGKGSIAHHSLDQWFNYVTGALDELMPQFKNGMGLVTTYGLVFRSKVDVPRFVQIVTELKDGKHMHLLKSPAPESATSKVLTTDAKHALPVEQPASEGEPKQSSQSISLSSTEPARITVKLPTPTTIVKVKSTVGPPRNGCSLAPVEPLIVLEATDMDEDPFNLFSPPPSEEQPSKTQSAHSPASHIELLATLDPVPCDDPLPYSESQIDDSTSQDENIDAAACLSPEEQAQLVKQMTQDMKDWIVQTTRSLLSCFLLGRDAGDTKTDIAATVEGIKDGLVAKCLENLESPSFPRGLSIQQKQEILDEFLTGTFGSVQSKQLNASTVTSEAQVVKPPLAGSDSSRRRSYSRQDLLLLKGDATEAPAQLRSPEFTPPLRKRTQSSVNPPPLNFNDSKDSMAWVQWRPTAVEAPGNGPSDTTVPSIVLHVPAEKSTSISPEHVTSSDTAVESGQTTKTTNSQEADSPKGLSHSRWVSPSENPIIGQKNFTGPGYEFRPGSALHQLSNLSMRARIEPTTKVDDILNLFVPMVSDTNGANVVASGKETGLQHHIVSNSLSELYESFDKLSILPQSERQTQESTPRLETASRRLESSGPTTCMDIANAPTSMAQSMAEASIPPSTDSRRSLASSQRPFNGLAASRHARR